MKLLILCACKTAVGSVRVCLEFLSREGSFFFNYVFMFAASPPPLLSKVLRFLMCALARARAYTHAHTQYGGGGG